MRQLIAVVCFLALPVFAESEYSMVEDARVMSTAIREWGKTFGPDTKVAVAAEYMSTRRIGISTFADELLKSGATVDRMKPLVENFYARNEAARSGAAPPRNDGDTSVRRFRMTTPGYDAERRHALVLGTPDDGWIYIALLENVSEEEWRTTWTSRMKPSQTEQRLIPGDGPIPGDVGPLRVGGDVKAPVLVQRVEPVYTQEALQARISGIVIVEVIIDRRGRVTKVDVLKPLPFGLDRAAIDAVKQWTFRPGTLNGHAVDVIFNLTVNFRPPE